MKNKNDTNNTTKKNINSLSEDEIKKLSYWELWGLRRNLGAFYYIFYVSLFALIVYLFIKICYLLHIRNFKFSFDWYSIPLALVVGVLYWVLHEKIYKDKYLDKHKD